MEGVEIDQTAHMYMLVPFYNICKNIFLQRERERERDRETDRQKQRERYRQTERVRDRKIPIMALRKRTPLSSGRKAFPP